MVKFENEKLRGSAVDLWQEAFGDSEEYINFFLDTHKGCTFVPLTENGELVSALYLIDGTLCGINGFYLFAAATFKEHRSKGYMARLLKLAEETAKQKNKSFIALVPAEKSLFDYYSRFGYKTAFYAKKQSKNLPVPQAENRFVWCKEHIDYILAEHAKYGTDILKNDGEIYSVFGSEYIKVPCERNEEYRYGMLLELDEKSQRLKQLNSYIGLTLE
ncbi:MAG: GNAT family N-acetyltransferase [Clostridia bacterium]|nr:GNAT family N-acetyltransferase [Clostridia bacterium]